FLLVHRKVRATARPRRLLHLESASERGRRAVRDGGRDLARAQLSGDALSRDQGQPTLAGGRAAGGLTWLLSSKRGRCTSRTGSGRRRSTSCAAPASRSRAARWPPWWGRAEWARARSCTSSARSIRPPAERCCLTGATPLP